MSTFLHCSTTQVGVGAPNEFAEELGGRGRRLYHGARSLLRGQRVLQGRPWSSSSTAASFYVELGGRISEKQAHLREERLVSRESVVKHTAKRFGCEMEFGQRDKRAARARLASWLQTMTSTSSGRLLVELMSVFYT